MIESNVRTFNRTAPFQPFYIKMADGTIHRFYHPEMLLVGKAAAYALAPNGIDFAILDLSLMTEAGIIPAAERAGIASEEGAR